MRIAFTLSVPILSILLGLALSALLASNWSMWSGAFIVIGLIMSAGNYTLRHMDGLP
jgi:hypothetical protein